MLQRINSPIRALWQEEKCRKELAYYSQKTNDLQLPADDTAVLADLLRQRFAKRGLNKKAKPKGKMNLFLAYKYSNWEDVLKLSLEPFGKVTCFDWGTLKLDDSANNTEDSRSELAAALLTKISTVHAEDPVDAFLGYFSSKNISPKHLRQIAAMGIVVFNMSLDDKLGFQNLAEIVSSVDLNLTNAPSSRVKYWGQGGLSTFWPEAAHPIIHKPYDLDFEYDVSFVGKKYGWRPRLVNYLRKNRIRVATFGQGWENAELPREEMIKLYSRSRINLGFAGVGQSRKLRCLKGRDFEIPMSGGLYLTQENPELELVYDIGNEILTYHNEKDCLKTIRWILEHPDEAENVRKAGRTKALREHTWEKRFEDIFRLAGLLQRDHDTLD